MPLRRDQRAAAAFRLRADVAALHARARPRRAGGLRARGRRCRCVAPAGVPLNAPAWLVVAAVGSTRRRWPGSPRSRGSAVELRLRTAGSAAHQVDSGRCSTPPCDGRVRRRRRCLRTAPPPRPSSARRPGRAPCAPDDRDRSDEVSRNGLPLLPFAVPATPSRPAPSGSGRGHCRLDGPDGPPHRDSGRANWRMAIAFLPDWRDRSALRRRASVVALRERRRLPLIAPCPRPRRVGAAGASALRPRQRGCSSAPRRSRGIVRRRRRAASPRWAPARRCLSRPTCSTRSTRRGSRPARPRSGCRMAGQPPSAPSPRRSVGIGRPSGLRPYPGAAASACRLAVGPFAFLLLRLSFLPSRLFFSNEYFGLATDPPSLCWAGARLRVFFGVECKRPYARRCAEQQRGAVPFATAQQPTPVQFSTSRSSEPDRDHEAVTSRGRRVSVRSQGAAALAAERGERRATCALPSGSPRRQRNRPSASTTFDSWRCRRSGSQVATSSSRSLRRRRP